LRLLHHDRPKAWRDDGVFVFPSYNKNVESTIEESLVCTLTLVAGVTAVVEAYPVALELSVSQHANQVPGAFEIEDVVTLYTGEDNHALSAASKCVYESGVGLLAFRIVNK